MERIIAVVIPCYRVRGHILEVVRSLPAWVSHVIVVDDKCPEGTAQYLSSQWTDKRLVLIQHETNQGVGGATISGFLKALELGAEVIVKMDGDGQMDPAYIPRLINPILAGYADFTKGNRFYDLIGLKSMPLARRIGNFGLTFLTKAASGFWSIGDPTNGYTAIGSTALRLLNKERLSRRYFFESSMLIELNIIRALAIDVPISARYGEEKSSLSILRSLVGFPPRLIRGCLQRIFWRYFFYDINAVSLCLLLGMGFLGFGVSFGAYRWAVGMVDGTFQSAGTIALALLPTIQGSQLLMQALLLDVMDKPVTALSRSINDQVRF